MAVKYTMPFYTTENIPCKVDFDITGYSGDPTTIIASESPFVLREFNSEDDVFKPVRGQQAEINIVASSSLNIDDFIGNADTYCKIYFYYNNSITPFWEGWLSQDDLQQEWTDQYKVISLRASDGFGYLKSQPYTNTSGGEVRGLNTVFSYIYDCLYNTSGFDNRRLYFINSLFNDNTDDTSVVSPLAQLYLDARTFSIGDGEYDDKYTVLEKINKAYNQTVFQYNNGLYTLRIEELYSPKTTNLRRYRFNAIALPAWSYTSLRYDVNIGVNQSIKPIEPKMLRMLNRNIKMNENDYFFNYPTEFITNQNFQRGSLISSTSTYKLYNVESWDWLTGTLASPTSSTGSKYRRDDIDTNGYVTDSYIQGLKGVGETNVFWRSTPIWAYKNDVIDLSFLWSSKTSTIQKGNYTIAYVYAKVNSSSYYFLNNEGDWEPHTTANFNFEKLTVKADNNEQFINGRYLEKSVLSKPLPESAFVYVVLFGEGRYAQMQFRYQSALSNVTTANIAGFKETFTKSDDIRQNDIEEIYLSDTRDNINLMGSIFFQTGTPGSLNPLYTTPNWYRLRYNSESFSFVRQNLTARYNFNKFNRNKIDANFYGVANSGTPIGLLNTFTFVDDDPNKIYMISNLKEMNFANNTWSATLVEVWDSARDTDTATTYPTYDKNFLYK